MGHLTYITFKQSMDKGTEPLLEFRNFYHGVNLSSGYELCQLKSAVIVQLWIQNEKCRVLV